MRGLSKKTEDRIHFAYESLEKNHPMTLRQLHYAIFSAAAIDYEQYAPLTTRGRAVTTVARRTHRFGELHMPDIPVIDGIPHDWIIDEQREAEMVSEWDDAAGYMDAVKSSYRRDNWQDQPRYCEVWSEKAPALGAMRPITQEFGVMLRACRGFGSTGMEGQVGYGFEEIKKPITVFYLGDHDPSGHDIGRDIHHRAQQASGKEFEMIRQAIHSEDIKTYNLPPQRIKTTDSRAAGFKRRFRARAATVELDALPVEVAPEGARSHRGSN